MHSTKCCVGYKDFEDQECDNVVPGEGSHISQGVDDYCGVMAGW